MTKKELLSLVISALNQFLTEDSTLLEVNASGRSISHKIAEHLQTALRKTGNPDGLTVDCEYNRDHKYVKRISDGTMGTGNSINYRRVFPSIVLHKRKSEGHNLLVIEAKKKSNPRHYDNDYLKLEQFTKSCQLNYQVGLFVLLDVKTKTIEITKCFRKGEDDTGWKSIKLPTSGGMERSKTSANTLKPEDCAEKIKNPSRQETGGSHFRIRL